jgi:hypothetical protein
MKCIKCDKDTGKIDRNKNGGKCPSCQHVFVTAPDEDGLTDKVIQTAEDLVTSDGMFYFLKSHLKYQLLRRTRKRLKWTSWFISFLLLFIVISLVLGLRGGLMIFTIIAGIALFVTSLIKGALYKTKNRLDYIVDKWIQINPNNKLLSKNNSFIAPKNQELLKDLEEISFERVLICDRDEYVDFFLANLFHFHYSCPVLGGNNYPDNVCPDMLKRLKKNQQLDIFLLHDYSPKGYAFAKLIKNDPRWFGEHSHFNFVDLGLLQEQLPIYKSMMVREKDLSKKNTRVQTLGSNRKVAELTLFQPEALISLCGMAINEKVPFHEVSSKANDSSGGYG